MYSLLFSYPFNKGPYLLGKFVAGYIVTLSVLFSATLGLIIGTFIPSVNPDLIALLDRRGGDLSGGQQQQLALGRALTLEPELLILDEPTEGIQPNIVHEIGDIITQLNQQLGLTVLLVEQKLPFARRVASDFCILEKGRNVAQGEIAALDDQLINQYLRV